MEVAVVLQSSKDELSARIFVSHFAALSLAGKVRCTMDRSHHGFGEIEF